MLPRWLGIWAPQPLVFALDSRGGRVAIDGWRKETAVTAFDMIRALEPFCDTFLYTHIDTEGLMAESRWRR
jgi:phosphoribosylformimino-5-aminoimidazole carboxamide ribotide isomerase